MMKKQERAKYTREDRAFSKMQYELQKYKLQDPLVEQTSKFSTFQEAYAKNLEQFKQKKTPKNAEQIEQEEIEYILNTMPFVREYYLETCVIDEREKEDDELINVRSVNTNKNTFQKYLYTVEKVVNSETIKSILETETPDSLERCKCGGHLQHIKGEACLVCEKCGKMQGYVESYSRAEDTECGMPYKRINHFTECLNALQGKEGTTVPDDVIEKVRAEFKKIRILSTSEIKPSKVNNILKNLDIPRTMKTFIQLPI